MNKSLIVGLAVVAAGVVGAWRFIAWANQSTLDVYNGTDDDIDVEVAGQVVHVRARGYRDIGKIANGTVVSAKRNGTALEEVTLEGDQTLHFVYNVSGAGELYVADYSGLYECKGQEGKPLGPQPIAIAATLKGQKLYSYRGRFLLGPDDPLPESGIDCSWGVVRSEIIPSALLGREDPLAYLTKRLQQQDKYRLFKR